MKERKLGILGRKVGMTRYFDDNGNAVGVTVLELGPCPVLGKRTKEAGQNGKADGYTALQLGFGKVKEKKLTMPKVGQLKAAGGIEKARRYVREVRVSDETAAKFEVGGEVSLGDLSFEKGQEVDVTGRSKGKGFQGVFHRYGFAGAVATHGSHESFRHGGSIGCRKFPGRVFKGQKMPGHQGDKRVTTQNIEIVDVRPDDNLLLLKGSVPGAKNSLVMVRLAVKKHPDA